MPSTRQTVSAGFALAFGALAATGAPAADGVRMTARQVTETLFKADAGTHPEPWGKWSDWRYVEISRSNGE